MATKQKRRSWVAICQPIDAVQFDASSMTIMKCWVSESDRTGATKEANVYLQEWLATFGPCKISLFEGDLTAQIFHGQV